MYVHKDYVSLRQIFVKYLDVRFRICSLYFVVLYCNPLSLKIDIR